MPVQSTFKNQSLYVPESVTATDCSTPAEACILDEVTGAWTRISTHADAESLVCPYTGPQTFVAGFRHTRYALDHPQEVLVYHHTNPVDTLENTTSRTSRWVVIWTDKQGDWELRLDTIYRTASLRDARKLITTLLTNIARADVKQSDWREAIASTTNQISVLDAETYDSDHKQALTEYTPWCEERDEIHRRGRDRWEQVKLQRREDIHRRARHGWEQLKQQRQETFEELKEEVAADEERGFYVREALPTTTEKTDELAEQYAAGELTFEEFTAKLETAWEDADMIPFEEALTAHQ